MSKIEVKEIKPQNKMPLDIAVPVVNAAIEEYRKKLKACSESDEESPIMVEGSTTTGYYCQLMVDPREVAEILLRWEYPTYRILEEEAPQGMWDELAEHFGLDTVGAFDL